MLKKRTFENDVNEINGIKFPMKLYGENEIVDAVVIGTGAGGAPLLSRLAKAGLKVVALEAGEHWLPSKDFATDEISQAKLFWMDERLSAGQDPVHFGNNNSGIGVGGSTLHYTAYVPRPQPDDFHLYSDFGVGVNWPIGYNDLEKYFDEIENFLGVSGPPIYSWGAKRSSSYPLAPLPLNGAAQLMKRGMDGRLGRRIVNRA
jgi:choline dehydrogenase-like flavoprotein